MRCCCEKLTCGICVDKGVFLNPKAATAAKLTKALGLPVSAVEYAPLGTGTEGALSSMCKMKLTYGGPDNKVAPQSGAASEMSRDLVIKCVAGGAERLFTDPWDMYRKEAQFYKLIAGVRARAPPVRTSRATDPRATDPRRAPVPLSRLPLVIFCAQDLSEVIRIPKCHYSKVASGGQGVMIFEDLSKACPRGLGWLPL